MIARRTVPIAGLLMAMLLAAPTRAQEAIPGPQVGEVFPHALAAPDQHGRERSLSDLYGANGVVLFFVRSADWCPFCRRQLVDINARIADFTALGMNVVSISVDEMPLIQAFADEQAISYTMLADPAGDINAELGIRDEQYPVGTARFGVPRPAAYVLDREGMIRARFMEPTYRTRPDLDAVLAAVRAENL